MKIPDNIKKCQGVESVFDIQLGELSTDSFKTLIPPQIIFR